MKRVRFAAVIMLLAAFALAGCQGILSGIYDDPADNEAHTSAGRLYVDASAWDKWHYIDLGSPEGGWQTFEIPGGDPQGAASPAQPHAPGIYTYWYDVFGAGIANYEFRGYVSTGEQPEPGGWTLAVHRNNIRTNGCGACETAYTSIGELPDGKEWLEGLDYEADSWNQTDVWAVQDRMLSGIIGNQGICVNHVLGRWLNMNIPPMPPTFAVNNHVFILRLSDGTFAALQLADYMSSAGVKCCLTINYRYPL